ncbi:outer membrane beta-barrel protein [Haliea sp. E17]|uniref:outer membrane beta-barrel protein n=1 Tax=Haliea sp. E17 TaxID=3401576 RepID=UPI003AAECFA0
MPAAHGFAAGDASDDRLFYGPLSLEPLLRSEAAYDDNLYYSPENTVDSWVSRVMPSVEGVIKLPDAEYTLGYQGEYGRFLESSDDNYEDHTFDATANLALAHRHRLMLSGSYALKHQGRGEGLTQGFDPETGDFQGFDPDGEPVSSPDKFNVSRVAADYYFGALDSGNRLKFSLSGRQSEYTNHRSRTRYRDHENMGAGLTFYHQVMPATSLLLEVRGNDISYGDTYPDTATLDSREVRYLAGAIWDITGTTSGTVKFGQVQKNFSAESRENFSGLDWEIDLNWEPRSYSQFEFSAGRSEEETYGEGDFIDTMTYSLGWNHGWSDLLQSNISVSYSQETYHGIDRDQDVVDYSLGLSYQWRHWLAFELGADYSDSDSNVDWLVYDQNIIRLGATLSL